MKFGFVTCVQLGLSCLEELYLQGAIPDLVLTLEDDMAKSKSGRVYLDSFCASIGAPLTKIRHIDDAAATRAIRSAQLDWLFIVGWSQIAGPEVLKLPRRGCVGMHPTLLPIGRGRASVPWAIIKGMDETGVSMFVLDEGVDTGSIIAQEVIPLLPDETATTLYSKVDAAHITLIRRTWPSFEAETVAPQPQDETQATVWPGRRPEDGAIHPGLTTADIDRLVRALAPPYPGARFVDDSGATWVIHPPEGPPATEPLNLPAADGVYKSHHYRPLPQTPESGSCE